MGMSGLQREVEESEKIAFVFRFRAPDDVRIGPMGGDDIDVTETHRRSSTESGLGGRGVSGAARQAVV
jgi:hypothetical protein